jgi:hypothetical protein
LSVEQRNDTTGSQKKPGTFSSSAHKQCVIRRCITCGLVKALQFKSKFTTSLNKQLIVQGPGIQDKVQVLKYTTITNSMELSPQVLSYSRISQPFIKTEG